MKDGLKISLACLLFLFVSYCASPIQAQPKYVRDFPPDPVKVFVDNGNGEVQIVFKWEMSGEPPPAGPKITCKITDAVGSFNTINAKDISFAWEEGPCLAPAATNSSSPAAETLATPTPESNATPTPAPILIGRLKVAGLHDFNDFSAPYTGYVVFFSETANVAPISLKFQLHRKPITSIASYLENITLPGTNFVPSFLSPLFPGLLYVLLGILFLLRGQFSDKKVLLIMVAVIILGVGALIGLSRYPGPKYSSVYIESPQLTQGRNDQTAVPAKEIGILTSDKSGWGKMYLEKKNGEYYLTFRELPRAGEYNGKIPADFISTPAIPVKVRVADWVLYFFVTVLGGILAARLMTLSIRPLPELNEAIVVAGGSVLTVLVTHFALYTDTWGSTLDYVKAFAAGAGVSFVSRSALALASRIARRSLREVEAP